MKKLGKVSVINKKGSILVKVNKAPRIGSKVVNQDIKSIGRIVDIIGPTHTPYAVINFFTSSISFD